MSAMEENTSMDFMDRLHRMSSRTNLPVEYLRYCYLTNAGFVIQMAKNPSKQNFYEKMAFRILSVRLPEIAKFLGISCDPLVKLPNGGKNALLVANGMVIRQGEYKVQNSSKSIDFMWRAGGHTIYFTHKYTNESGGAQDNQYKDIILFLTASRGSKDDDITFVAICDGDYYQRVDNNNKNKMMILRELYCNVHSRVININELTVEFIRDILKC